MFQSLRTRLVATVLALAGAGLIILAGVTYTEQASYLRSQLTRQLHAAMPAVGQALTLRPTAGAAEALSAATSVGPASSGMPAAPSAAGAQAAPPNLPPGTYGQLRGPADKVMREATFSYGEEARPAPALPLSMKPGQVIEVGSSGHGTARYLALASNDPRIPGLIVVALPMANAEAVLNRLLAVESIVVIAALVALAAAAWLLISIGLRPLVDMASTAEQIAAGQLSHRIEVTSAGSEVGRLGAALNRMLDRLERAFRQRASSEQRLRTFLADASHELRTPLASIRGYAELYRMGAAADPHALDNAMGRIEEESIRMGTLVEDLLLLARSEAEAPVPHERIDLAVLVEVAVRDARARAADRQITLVCPKSAIIEGSADQIRGVLANLLGNAIAHTSDGTTIEVILIAEHKSVKLTVRDHGQGLPDGAPERLFERFWRGTKHGKQGSASGTGLGLAIVKSIVAAHRGEVTAAAASNGGAIFTVQLPIFGSDAEVLSG